MRGDTASPRVHRRRFLTLASKTELRGRVEVLPLPAPVLRDLKRLSADVVREESEKTPLARKVYASSTKFQALVAPWDRVGEGAYQSLVAG